MTPLTHRLLKAIRFLLQIRKCRALKIAKTHGMQIGDRTRFMGWPQLGTEPYLISIGRDCLIAPGVEFICHDGAIQVPLIKSGMKLDDVYARKSRFGRIHIGDNCFIGAGAKILLDTKIGDNCIVGAGAIVRGAFQSDSVIIGNPGRIINSLSDYDSKNRDKITSFPRNQSRSARQEKILKEVSSRQPPNSH